MHERLHISTLVGSAGHVDGAAVCKSQTLRNSRPNCKSSAAEEDVSSILRRVGLGKGPNSTSTGLAPYAGTRSLAWTPRLCPLPTSARVIHQPSSTCSVEVSHVLLRARGALCTRNRRCATLQPFRLAAPAARLPTPDLMIDTSSVDGKQPRTNVQAVRCVQPH